MTTAKTAKDLSIAELDRLCDLELAVERARKRYLADPQSGTAYANVAYAKQDLAIAEIEMGVR